jgi:hypothetical protein
MGGNRYLYRSGSDIWRQWWSQELDMGGPTKEEKHLVENQYA